MLHPDDPVALLNQILDEPLGQPDTRTVHNAQPWMTSRMSPVMSTGRRAAAAGDPGPAWFGDLPGMFSSSSSPSKPAAIIDSRKHRVHELGPTEKRFPTLGLLQVATGPPTAARTEACEHHLGTVSHMEWEPGFCSPSPARSPDRAGPWRNPYWGEERRR